MPVPALNEVSMGFTPVAFCLINASPVFGSGMGQSVMYSRTDDGPCLLKTTAFISTEVFMSRPGTTDSLLLLGFVGYVARTEIVFESGSRTESFLQ